MLSGSISASQVTGLMSACTLEHFDTASGLAKPSILVRVF
jgi:hypothetical protein